MLGFFLVSRRVATASTLPLGLASGRVTDFCADFFVGDFPGDAAADLSLVCLASATAAAFLTDSFLTEACLDYALFGLARGFTADCFFEAGAVGVFLALAFCALALVGDFR